MDSVSVIIKPNRTRMTRIYADFFKFNFKIGGKEYVTFRDYRKNYKSLISPASAVTFAALSLGKTGIQEHERFLNSIKTYKPIFTKWVNEKMMRSLNLLGGEQPKPVLDDMPQFDFKPMSVSESFSLALPDLIILALMTILLFVGAFVSFLRYDIR